MKLFQKKEPREIKEDDSLFVKIWYNKRYHAIMSLSLYFIFFLIIIILVNVSSSKNAKDTTINGTYTQKYFDSLSNKDISYNYIINQGNKTYYFSGINKNDGVFGNILYNGESTSINITNNECVVGVYNEDEFVPAYTLCPGNINYSYFDYNSIYNMIKDKKGTIDKYNNYFKFSLSDSAELIIYYKDDTIDKIVINDNKNSVYELNYAENDIQENETEEE